MNASSIAIYGPTQSPTGTIEIEQAPGCDTTVEFPVPVQEKTSKAGQSDPAAAKPKRSLRILCIDDDAQIREFMMDCLKHFKHQVVVASGGKQGLELFRTATLENQPYEMVITDLGMPEVDGHLVARTIKAESPNTPVIMMTGWGTTLSDAGADASELDAVVGKPPRMHELNDLILRMATSAQSRVETER